MERFIRGDRRRAAIYKTGGPASPVRNRHICHSPVSVLELGATVFVWPPLYATSTPLSLRALPAVYLGLGGYLPRLDLDFEGLLDAVALDFD